MKRSTGSRPTKRARSQSGNRKRQTVAQGKTRAEKVIKWIEGRCRIPEGRDVGKPVRLRVWQRKEIHRIYGNPYGTRRGILSFGRKNGKTTLAACLLLCHLCGTEAIPNSQLYSAAQSRDQASLLFNLATKMVRLNEDLNSVIIIRETVKQLVWPEGGSRYMALSADASTNLGLSPVFIVHDELGQVRGPRSCLLYTSDAADD